MQLSCPVPRNAYLARWKPVLPCAHRKLKGLQLSAVDYEVCPALADTIQVVLKGPSCHQVCNQADEPAVMQIHDHCGCKCFKLASGLQSLDELDQVAHLIWISSIMNVQLIFRPCMLNLQELVKYEGQLINHTFPAFKKLH
jgi:hypothetical protein